jgi:hypothetical protein
MNISRIGINPTIVNIISNAGFASIVLSPKNSNIAVPLIKTANIMKTINKGITRTIESNKRAINLFQNPAYSSTVTICGAKPQLLQELDISLISEPHFSHFKISPP